LGFEDELKIWNNNLGELIMTKIVGFNTWLNWMLSEKKDACFCVDILHAKVAQLFSEIVPNTSIVLLKTCLHLA